MILPKMLGRITARCARRSGLRAGARARWARVGEPLPAAPPNKACAVKWGRLTGRPGQCPSEPSVRTRGPRDPRGCGPCWFPDLGTLPTSPSACTSAKATAQPWVHPPSSAHACRSRPLPLRSALQGSGIGVLQEVWVTLGAAGLVPGRRLRARGPKNVLPGALHNVPRLGGAAVFRDGTGCGFGGEDRQVPLPSRDVGAVI